MSISNVKEGLCIRLLRFLEPKQLAGFEAYLKCSLFNTNTSLVTFYQAIREKALRQSEKPLSPEELFKGTGIRPGMFAKYASQLVNHLEQFIPFWEQKDDPRHGFADGFSAWERMGLDQDLLERQYRKMKRKAEKLPPSEWQYFQAFELEHRYLNYKAGQPRKDQAPLFEAAESAFEELQLITRLRYYCARISLRRSLPIGSEREFSLANIQEDQLPPLGKAYYRAAQLLEAQAPDLEETTQFYAWLKEQQKQFSLQDRQDLFGFLLNICIPFATKAPLFTQLLDEVYAEMVAARLLHTQGHLPGSHFKNIVSIKIRLGSWESANQFIERHHPELVTQDQEILLPYTQGLVAYHQGSYRPAVALFRKVLDHQLADVYWGMEARLMLWRTYYEILEDLDPEEHSEFIRQYDALRIYVSRRNHLSPQQKTAYEHFIRIFNRLAHMKEESPTKEELQTLQSEVQGLPVIKQRSWLLSVIDRELEAIG